MKRFFFVLIAGMITVLTLIVRIPIPGTGGYLNLGDIGVVFCGLFIGGWRGAIVAGLGSAAADVIGGFFIFAPITFIAKGLEALIAGTLAKRKLYWVILGGLSMVTVYFVAEIFLPGMGFGVALSEIPFNLIQALAGILGGITVYKGITIALPAPDSETK